MPKPHPIAIATSDTHLQNRAWAKKPGISGDAYHAFQYICDYAIKRDLPIFAAGDLIDKQLNEEEPIRFVRHRMDELRDAGVGFYFIQGQHELQAQPWLLAVHDHPIWMHDGAVEFPEEGITVAGLDWQPADKLVAALQGEHGQYNGVSDETDILLMHQVCEEFMGSVCPTEMSFGMVPHARLLVIGDYHKHVVKNTIGANGQELRVLSPGSTCLQSIDEPPEKKFFVIYSDLTAKSVRIPSRPLLQPPALLLEEDLDKFVKDVRTQVDLAEQQAAKEGLPAELRKPLIWVHYSYDITDAHSRLERAIGDAGYFFPKELDPPLSEEKQVEKQRRDEVADLGLVGCLELVVEDKKSLLYKYTRRVLESQNPKEELAGLRQEFGL